MATKAGKIQFKDIRQGKVFWTVHCDFSENGTPWVREIEREIVASRPFKEALNKRGVSIWWFKTLDKNGKASKYPFNLSELLGRYNTKRAEMGMVYTFTFLTKKAAKRYAEEFKQRLPTESDLDRLRQRYEQIKADMKYQDDLYQNDMEEDFIDIDGTDFHYQEDEQCFTPRRDTLQFNRAS